MPPLLQFERQLAEAVTWCTNREQLRSGAFEPTAITVTQSWPECQKRPSVIAYVNGVRSYFLWQRGDQIIPPPFKGRLLAFDPDGSADDGAAQVCSEGFFDEFNTPPWDTWIAYIIENHEETKRWEPYDSYLLSWVPEEWRERVESGIEANPEGCLQWASELEQPFIKDLAAADILF